MCLDSNHTHEHALAELKAYAPLVSVGSYCVVFDTVIEDLPAAMLFVPSIGGRSHTTAENTRDEDILLGCQVLSDAVERVHA